MHKALILAATIVATACSVGAASAADVTISKAAGKAFVDNGSGFAIAQMGTTVAAGSRVMAMSGDVVLSDASGCTMTVKPGDMLAVNGQALCASAMLPAAQSAGDTKKDSQGRTWIWWVGGGVALATGAWILAENDNRKTSP